MEKLNPKIKKYEKILLGILQELKERSQYHHLIVDKLNRHYQIVYAGPDYKGMYIYKIRVHFHLRADGKLCVFENATEIEFLDILLPKGIPKSDLLPHFMDESLREVAGYAVA